MSRPLHEDTAVLLIDAQTSFVDNMAGAPEPLLMRLERLGKFAQLLDLPVIATLEQPVDEKGGLPERVGAALPRDAAMLEKSAFDCMTNDSIRAALVDTGRKHIAVAGAETDVCVLLSVLGLRAAGYEVFLLRDCLFSSTVDVDAAIERMGGCGGDPDDVEDVLLRVDGHRAGRVAGGVAATPRGAAGPVSAAGRSAATRVATSASR